MPIREHTRIRATRRLTVSVVLLVAACGSTGPEKSDVVEAVATPLTDLNLVRQKIPPVLLRAQRGPYAAPADQSCAGLYAEVRALHEVLGNDYDTPAAVSSRTEFTAAAVGKAAVKTVKRTAEGVVPFRSWVRKLSGAERNSKEVAGAIAAGASRRAFLKGMIAAKQCELEAIPFQVVDSDAESDAAVPMSPAE